MAIWFPDFPIRFARERSRGTLISHLGIELLEAGEDDLAGRMLINRPAPCLSGLAAAGHNHSAPGT